MLTAGAQERHWACVLGFAGRRLLLPVEVTFKLCSQGEFHHIQATLKMRPTSQEPRKPLSLVSAVFSFPPTYITRALTLMCTMVLISPKANFSP